MNPQPDFVGQNTMRVLNEMGSDLAGMGVTGLDFDENNMMMRQATAMQQDPAMMQGPTQVIQPPQQV